MIDHIRFDRERGTLILLDQRELPGKIRHLDCSKSSEVIAAIKTLAVRGAPAIGVAGAWACLLAAYEVGNEQDWRWKLAELTSAISNARPTAVNLAWAVGRMNELIQPEDNPASLHEKWLAEAEKIQNEDVAICHAIGQNGAGLIQDGDTILTHCNAGALATAGYGTALGVIRAAHEQGKKIAVIADETRPLLQGSRLTAWELEQDNIPVRIACDNACAHLLANKMTQIVITGADRIAMNGDSANKIGTCGVAIIAKYYNIPFYIAAPLSTFDRRAGSGADIPVERRESREVTQIGSQQIAPEGVEGLNFAFDVTPADLISGIITEVGILRPPYVDSIAQAFKKAGRQ